MLGDYTGTGCAERFSFFLWIYGELIVLLELALRTHSLVSAVSAFGTPIAAGDGI